MHRRNKDARIKEKQKEMGDVRSPPCAGFAANDVDDETCHPRSRSVPIKKTDRLLLARKKGMRAVRRGKVDVTDKCTATFLNVGAGRAGRVPRGYRTTTGHCTGVALVTGVDVTK